MAKLLKLRRGTTTQHGSFTGEQGEVTVDTDKTTLVVHPGGTEGGGEALLREDLDNMPNSGVTAGTYGSASAIPAITVDAKGLVTSATTNAIDSTTISNGTSEVAVSNNGDITVTRAGVTTFETIANGVRVKGGEGAQGILELSSDEGDDTSDKFRLVANDTGPLFIQGDGGSGWETNIRCVANNETELYHNNNLRLATTSGGINVTGDVTCDGLTSDGTATFATTTEYQAIFKDSNNTGVDAETGIAFSDSGDTVQGYLGHTTNNGIFLLSNVLNNEVRFATNNTGRCRVTGDGHFTPVTNNASDLGSSTSQWKDGYFDGVVNCDGLSCDGQIVAQNTAEYQLVVKDSNSTGTAAETGIAFRDSGDTVQGRIGHVANGNSILYVFNDTNEEIRFGTNATGRCRVQADGHFTPIDDDSIDLGTSSLRWRNIYTMDMNLSNEGSSNDVDGTWGSWTIQEGEDDLFLLNRRNGKKYKFNLSEVN